MRFSFHRFAAARPFAAGVLTGVISLLGAVTLVAAANRVHPFVTGTIDYEDTTAGPIIVGVQSGGGIGVEGATDTGAPAGAIALQGFGTSTSLASVGVNGAVEGPGSTGLIGNANDTTGAASIGLEGFSANGEGVFAQSLSPSFPSLRSLDGSGDFDVRLSDVPDGNALSATLSVATDGAAVVGTDTAPTSSRNSGVYGLTTVGFAGVQGVSLTSGAAAGVIGVGLDTVTGTEGDSSSGSGVVGSSAAGAGIFGQSSTGDGGVGVTQNPATITDSAAAGLMGVDSSNDGGTVDDGVLGMSTNGIGVEAESGFIGLDVASTGPVGVLASAQGGTAGEFSDSASNGVGVTSVAGIALAPMCLNAGGDLLIGEDQGSTPVWTLDCTGAITTVVRTRHDLYANASTPQSTQPVLEDYGQGQLVNGSASIKLDAAFAETISDGSPYLVFVTPDGQSRGLYVTQKTMTGFVVRENDGGASNIAFDYRIVAKPAHVSRGRMVVSATVPHAVRTPRVDLHIQPRFERFAMRDRSARAVRTATQAKLHLALARANRHAPKRLPMYEPHMGADGRLKPGHPYVPNGHGRIRSA